MQATQIPTVTLTVAADLFTDHATGNDTGGHADFVQFLTLQDQELPVLPVWTGHLSAVSRSQGIAIPSGDQVAEQPDQVGQMDGSGPILIETPLTTPEPFTENPLRHDLPRWIDPADRTLEFAFPAIPLTVAEVESTPGTTLSGKDALKALIQPSPGVTHAVPAVGPADRFWRASIADTDQPWQQSHGTPPGQSEPRLSGPSAPGAIPQTPLTVPISAAPKAGAVVDQPGLPTGLSEGSADTPPVPVGAAPRTRIADQIYPPAVKSDPQAPRPTPEPHTGIPTHIKTGPHLVELGQDLNSVRAEAPIIRPLADKAASPPNDANGAHVVSGARASAPPLPPTRTPLHGIAPAAVEQDSSSLPNLPELNRPAEPAKVTTFVQLSNPAPAFRAEASSPINMASKTPQWTEPDAGGVAVMARLDAADHQQPAEPAQLRNEQNQSTRDTAQATPRQTATPLPQTGAQTAWVPAHPTSASLVPRPPMTAKHPASVAADTTPAAAQPVRTNGPVPPQTAILGPALLDAAYHPKRSTDAELSSPAPGRVSTPPPAIVTEPGLANLNPAAHTVHVVPGADPVLEEHADYFGELTVETVKTDFQRDMPRIIADPKIPRQIAEQLAGVIRQGANGPVDVTLNPEELGRVRMRLSASEGTMAVSLTIERPETADLMRRNLAALSAEFRQLGYSDVTFSFSGSGAGQGSSDDGQTATVETSGETPNDGSDATAAQATSIASTIALDLRI